MMTLVDTSVWINHLKQGDRRLGQLLEDGAVVCHPFVIGELACGGIKNRTEVLSLLGDLPRITVIDEPEFREFLEQHRLWGQGLGFVDIHLLASAQLDGAKLWTSDAPLKRATLKLGLGV